MSIRMKTLEITPEEGDTAQHVKEVMQENLTFFAKRHPEFNFGIQVNEDRNTVTVKTISLDDNAN